ncbi:S8 family serine peptidase [Patescibacteria group bacterium]|nr:S8 family serine peptidase [Patescibacteria group bacterium]
MPTTQVKELLSILLISTIVLFVFVINNAYAGYYDRDEQTRRELGVLDTFRDDQAAIRGDLSEQQNIDIQAATEIVEIEGRDYVAGEVIVKFKEKKVDLKNIKGKRESNLFAQSKNLLKVDDIEVTNSTVLKAKNEESVVDIISRLKGDDTVEYVEPNYFRFPEEINTNDTYRELLWGIENTGQYINENGTDDADIDGLEAWGISEGLGDVIVAVIDTGVAYEHPDLKANMWDGSSCVDDENNPMGGCNYGYDYADDDKIPLPLDSSHGTHVAGTIAAVKNNGKGIIGVAPGVKLMALRFGFDTASEARAINFAINNGAKIINASYGGVSFSQTEFDAIEAFRNSGGLFVASAGNDSSDNDVTLKYPASYELDNILVVAATDQNDNLASFSNYGYEGVDVGAPGVNIVSAIADLNIVSIDFFDVTPPAIPSLLTKKSSLNYWGTYDLGGGWGKVLYGDVFNYPYASSGVLGESVSRTIQYNQDIDLGNAASAIMSFWVRCDTEYVEDIDVWNDYIALNIMRNNEPDSKITYEKFNEFYIDYLNEESPYSDDGMAYMFYSESIPAEYLTSDFGFELDWVVNDTGVGGGDGCLVDEIELAKYGDGSDEVYGYKNGTSMAAPHVSGLAALLFSYNPNLTYVQIKNIIKSTGDSLPELDGKVITGKRINAYNSLSIFDPHAGFDVEDVITANQVVQANDGTGSTTINFKLKDGVSNLSMTLSSFEYSLDGGNSWGFATTSDESLAFSSAWSDNYYVSAMDLASTTYSFFVNTKHSDFIDLNLIDSSDVKFRFKVNDGATTSPFAVSEAFRIDNEAPEIVLSAPIEDVVTTSTQYILEGNTEFGSLVNVYKDSILVAADQLEASSTFFSIPVILDESQENVFSLIAIDFFGNASYATTTPIITQSTSTLAIVIPEDPPFNDSENEVVIVPRDNQVLILPEISLNSIQNQAILIEGQESFITIPVGVNNPTLDISYILENTATSTQAILATTTISVVTSMSATPVLVSIPNDTQVVGPVSWDGIINAPIVQANSTAKPTADSGKMANVYSVLEVGAGDTELLFDRAVRLFIPGVAGREIGYERANNFNKIINICSNDSQLVGDAQPSGSECRIDIANDTVIWTKHFTKFVAYGQTDIIVPGVVKPSGGGGGGGGYSYQPESQIVEIQSVELQTTEPQLASYQVYNIKENVLVVGEPQIIGNIKVGIPGVPDLDKNGNITLE